MFTNPPFKLLFVETAIKSFLKPHIAVNRVCKKFTTSSIFHTLKIFFIVEIFWKFTDISIKINLFKFHYLFHDLIWYEFMKDSKRYKQISVTFFFTECFLYLKWIMVNKNYIENVWIFRSSFCLSFKESRRKNIKNNMRCLHV